MEPPKRPSLHLAADAGAGVVGVGVGAVESPTSAGFLPDMPQWKKDLIQRRKTNVARTQAAVVATISPTSADIDMAVGGGGSCVALIETAGAGAGAAAAGDLSATEASQQQQLLAKRTTELTEEKSEKSFSGGHHTQPTNSAETTTTTLPIPIPLPIPKQRSSLFNTTTRSQSTNSEQEPQILNMDLREPEPERERERDVVVSSCGFRGEVETGTAAAATTGALSGGSSSGSSSANQLQTKCKPKQSVAEPEEGGSSTKELPLIDNKNNCKTKTISDKLQSNKFIQQQQQQQQQKQQPQQLSPTKVTVKTTMVAMQEMKKTTTQNGQHRHTHLMKSQPQPQQPPQQQQEEEDLSYGPGIVSKLRCRYLSLALRESRQQNQKQRLQRSTSLNTLLDRDDEEEEVIVPTVATTKTQPPPILTAKPIISPAAGGYIKASQQQQRPMSLGNHANHTNGEARSRHLKRGNEVMKRARSVEALLCEKSPWNTQRAAISPSTPSPTCVTIEDKIHNARERLHSGTDTTPPKRLTSIIDDTERPPPDLVKQTLKMFEASANRRPRAAHRTNGVGGVASKVASYKSIIKEQQTNSPAPLAVKGLSTSTPKPMRPQEPDIIPRQVDSPVTALTKLMGRIQLDETQEGGTEPPKQTESLVSDKLTTTHEVSDDEGDEHVDDEDGDGDDADDDNMGAAAAGDKPKPPTIALAEGGGVGGAQRSFVAATNENAHVPSSSSSSSRSTVTTTKQIGVIRPLFNNSSTPLTTREIEKNRINEMKKSTAGLNSEAPAAAAAAATTSSLDTVISTSETDAANAASPIWAVRKLRPPQANAHAGPGQGQGASNSNTENTSMVFNFSKSSKEVPDYIESDVVIFRRKRDLPKPNEPGFVLLGDLSVETSTDTDYDDYSMCPPSPCDVEFENANVVIDGKSSIRQKAKESSFRVQFNDTLTSTFEYPSESSLIIDDPPYADPFGAHHHQLLMAEQMQLLQHQQQQQQQHHHHVAVDEIIELPTSTASSHKTSSSSASSSTATSNMLGNLPLDYPKLEKGIILQQPTTPAAATPLPPPEPQQPVSRPDPVAVAAAAPLPLHRRMRPSVLLKPQYACFLQNDALPQPKPQPRKAASFSHGQHQQPKPPQQQSKYKPPTTTTSTARSSRSKTDSSYRRRPSLPVIRSSLSSSLALPNASTALLQARIPGNTLYYV